eukprot:CAMPEP_0180580808 /NCGR_PEP_ID=MMETSP1037_2-20121125/13718_1 /TAXON_ID=632150 /ORGANISM="Azadinium spinosum, Strain 3D9" /LENGTH=335 /DNA_ID=CAMNT_0022598753 /DNA_START=312 /DNA_END=1316 /DNA_ORIENTATION=+
MACGGRSIAGVIDTCTGATVGSTCYAMCGAGYSLTGGAQKWTCAMDAGGLTPSLQGTVPNCTGMPCLNNFPSGNYAHNCTGIVTGKNCTVRCGDGLVGTSEVFMCMGAGSLEGISPTCLAPTTTLTATATSTTTTMSTTTTVVTTVEGSLELTVSDPQGFAADPEAMAAVAESIAGLAGVAVGTVNVTLSVVSRRLASQVSGNMRRLEGSNLLVQFIIAVPMATATTVGLALVVATPTQATSLITAALTSRVGAGAYAVTTNAISQPTVAGALWASTITTTTTTIPISKTTTLDPSKSAEIGIGVASSMVVFVLVCLGCIYMYRRANARKESHAC